MNSPATPPELPRRRVGATGPGRRGTRSHLRRIAAAVGGGALVLVGVALLVLPGPGFVMIAAGLGVLATQYAWARRPLRYARVKAGQGVAQVSRSVLYTVFTAVCAIALLVVGIAGIAGVDVPFLGLTAGIFITASGLFLLASIVYARGPKGALLARRRSAG